jgi:hypothetical protein
MTGGSTAVFTREPEWSSGMERGSTPGLVGRENCISAAERSTYHEFASPRILVPVLLEVVLGHLRRPDRLDHAPVEAVHHPFEVVEVPPPSS